MGEHGTASDFKTQSSETGPGRQRKAQWAELVLAHPHRTFLHTYSLPGKFSFRCLGILRISGEILIQRTPHTDPEKPLGHSNKPGEQAASLVM